MMQKVIQIGSSAAVIIPKGSLEELGMKIGDQVRVEVHREDQTVTVKPLVTITNELADWTKGFIKKYRQALEALAKE